jgi:membrane protein
MTLLKELGRRFMRDEVMDLSAQCAYYFLLSLFPFLIFTITLLGFLPITAEDVLNLIETYSPGRINELIQANVYNILNQRNTGLLSFSILLTVWPASYALNAIVTSLNKAYNIDAHSFVKSRAISILLTLGMIIVILMALTLTVFGQMIGRFMYEIIGVSDFTLYVWQVARFTISFAVLLLVFSFVYYLGPNLRVRWRDIWAGTVFAAMGWQLTSIAFSYYVNNFANFTATYGSLGGVIVLMLWFQVSAMILIIGGQINALYASDNGK